MMDHTLYLMIGFSKSSPNLDPWQPKSTWAMHIPSSLSIGNPLMHFLFLRILSVKVKFHRDNDKFSKPHEIEITNIKILKTFTDNAVCFQLSQVLKPNLLPYANSVMTWGIPTLLTSCDRILNFWRGSTRKILTSAMSTGSFPELRGRSPFSTQYKIRHS
jgi:hypothetical protein